MKLDPVDQPKIDQMIADYMYFMEKYGGAEFGQWLFARMLAPHSDKLLDKSEEEKDYILAAGMDGLSKCAATMHDQLFPFGHAGQPLEIQE